MITARNLLREGVPFDWYERNPDFGGIWDPELCTVTSPSWSTQHWPKPPMDPADLSGCAGRLFDHFAVRPDHYRLIGWGRLELTDALAAPGNPIQVSTARKLEQLCQAQLAGQLDPSWDPVDILALVSRLALTWSARPELRACVETQAQDNSLPARRTALVAAVERLFPSAGHGPSGHRRLGPPEEAKWLRPGRTSSGPTARHRAQISTR